MVRSWDSCWDQSRAVTALVLFKAGPDPALDGSTEASHGLSRGRRSGPRLPWDGRGASGDLSDRSLTTGFEAIEWIWSDNLVPIGTSVRVY